MYIDVSTLLRGFSYTNHAFIRLDIVASALILFELGVTHMNKTKLSLVVFSFFLSAAEAQSGTEECAMVRGLRAGISALPATPTGLQVSRTEATKILSLRSSQVAALIQNINDSKIKFVVNPSALQIIERVEAKLVEAQAVTRGRDANKSVRDQTRLLIAAKNFFISAQNMSCGNTDWETNR